jgi:hypothetical protein
MRLRGRFFGRVLLVVAVVAVASWLVMQLWNTVVVATLNGVHSLDYVHALGLLILCRLLFGGFGGRGLGYRRAQWERWQALTPEQREQLTQRWDGCRRARSGSESA